MYNTKCLKQLLDRVNGEVDLSTYEELALLLDRLEKLEAVAEAARVHQRYYPTIEELEWALAALEGKV